MWYRVASRKNEALGQREGCHKEKYPSMEDFEQYMEDKYLFSRQPRTLDTIERFDRTLRARGRRMDCEDCGRYNNIDSCSSCRLYNDETSYILGKQAALVEAVKKEKLEEVSQEMDNWCAKRTATVQGLTYKLGRTEASRRDDYKRAEYDPNGRHLLWERRPETLVTEPRLRPEDKQPRRGMTGRPERQPR